MDEVLWERIRRFNFFFFSSKFLQKIIDIQIQSWAQFGIIFTSKRINNVFRVFFSQSILGNFFLNFSLRFCWIWPLAVLHENQLIYSEKSQNLLWHLNYTPTKHVFRDIHADRTCYISNSLPWLIEKVINFIFTKTLKPKLIFVRLLNIINKIQKNTKKRSNPSNFLSQTDQFLHHNR